MEAITPWLGIPRSKLEEIQLRHGRGHSRSKAYFEYFLQEHPAPSWMVVGNAMWQVGENIGAIQLLQMLYLKGKACVHDCEGGLYICIL